jgi:hypothetical protein
MSITLFSDYLVTRSYFDDERKYSPTDLIDLRSATVKNVTFGVMAARHAFQAFLKFESENLEYSLRKFHRIQERFGHQMPDDVSCCIIFILKLHLIVSLSLSDSTFWCTPVPYTLAETLPLMLNLRNLVAIFSSLWLVLYL